jgi:hypothetical protein
MSSTDPKQTKALTSFFEASILPLGRGSGTILDHGPKIGSASYFLKRPKTRLAREDFQVKLSDERTLARTLDDQWVGTPLKGLGKAIAKLTRAFPETQVKAELSSSFYEMF